MRQITPAVSSLPFFAFMFVLAVVFVLPAASAQNFESGMLGPGETFRHTFDSAGEARYHCHPHPWMDGRILIDPSDDAAPTTHRVEIVESGDSSSAWAFAPAEITIQAGDTVEWINRGSAEHQVMATVGTTGHQDDDGHHDGDAGESPAGAWPLILVVVASVGMWARRRS